MLGNYGLNSLRFVKPVKPGERIKVRLTCAEKSLKAEKGWGEVAWDTEITNDAGDNCGLLRRPDDGERPSGARPGPLIPSATRGIAAACAFSRPRPAISRS